MIKIVPIKRPLVVILLLISALLSLPLAGRCLAVSFMGNGTSLETNYVPGQIIIKIKPKLMMMSERETSLPSSEVAIRSPAVSALNDRLGVTRVDYLIKPAARTKFSISSVRPQELADFFVIYLPEGEDTLSSIDQYLALADVEIAQPNYLHKIDLSPDDPYFAGATDSDINKQWGLVRISAESAWDITTGTKEVKICILDTGVDYKHPDLAANMWINSAEDINHDGIFENWPSTMEIGGVTGDLDGIDEDGKGYVDDVIGYDFVSTGSVDPGEDPGPPDPDPMDFNGHGTHCSGIASAVTNNGIGVAGLGYNCRIMAVRAGFSSGGSGYLLTTDIVNGLTYAANMGADVISMSFGGGEDPAEAAAIAFAASKGCVLVAAAGNGNSAAKNYPAAYDNVLSVAATYLNDNRAYFSSYGTWVDVSAPGQYIWSTFIRPASTEVHTYARLSGTSMATPLVAGLAGLVKSLHPTWANSVISQQIMSTADNIDAANPGFVGMLGSGRINARSALESGLLPFANITSPGTELYYNSYSGTVEIMGTATGSNFESYMVMLMDEANPGVWTQIGSTHEAEVLGSTLEVWDTRSSNDGQYVIRLYVRSTDGKTVSRDTLVNIENSFISSPDDGMLIGNSVQNIIGSIAGKDFTNYTAEWALGTDPSSGWSADGITLLNNGTLEVPNGPICAWTPPTTPPNDQTSITLRVRINYSGRQDEKRIHFLKDNWVHSGWPAVTDFTVYSSPAMADIVDNGAGKKEIAAVTSRNYNLYVDGGDYAALPRSIYLFDEHGSTIEAVPGWPQKTRALTYWDHSPCVGDFNGDNKNEIAVYDRDYLYLLKGDGSSINGAWPKAVADGNSSMSIFDVDQDGKCEIFAESFSYPNYYMHLFRGDGTEMPGWPVMCVGQPEEIAVGDINNDGSPEVVITTYNNCIDVFSARGYRPTGFPFRFPSNIVYGTGPLLADLDNDENLEIITLENNNLLYVIKSNGTVKSGYPVLTFGDVYEYLALGDIDNDGKPEIVGCVFTGQIAAPKIWAVNEDGTTVPGFPYYTHDNAICFAPAIADVDGDGWQEIIFTSKSNIFYPYLISIGRTHIIRHDGTVEPGWPRYMTDPSGGSTCQMSVPAIGDIDGDGFLNMAIGNAYYTKRLPLGYYNGGKVVVFDLPGSAESKIEWETFQGDNFHSGRYHLELDPPYVTGTSPSSGDLLLPTNAVISVKFSERISTNAATTPSNFKVYGTKSGVHATHPAYSTAESTVVINQYGLFRTDETVICTVEGDIYDLCGNRMSRYYPVKKYTFSFQTSDISLSGIVLRSIPSASTLYTKVRSVLVRAQNVSGTPETMILSEESDFLGADYQPYINPYTFELSAGDGKKTVYYKLRNSFLRESQTVEGSIILDTVSPEVHVAGPNALSIVNSSLPEISVTFTEPINQNDGYNSDYFSVYGSLSGSHATNPSFEPPPNQNKVIFNQDGDFTAGETVTCNLSGNIRDLAANPMGSDYGWSFYMARIALSSIRLTNPTTGRGTATNSRTISVEALGVFGLPDSMMISEEADFADASWEPYSRISQFLLSNGEGPKTVHYKLKSGDYISDPVFSSIALDTTLPELNSTIPPNGAFNTPTPSNIQLNFNEAMTNDSFSMLISPTVYLSKPSASSEGKSLVISNVNFSHGALYTATIESGEDLAGNEISGLPYSFWFTTTSGDTMPPNISNIRFDGTVYSFGAIISPQPKLTARIVDAGLPSTGIDPSSIHILIEGLGTFPPDTFEGSSMSLDVTDKLSPKTYLITIEASDLSLPPNKATFTCRVKVMAGGAKILGAPASYPAVFKPLSGSPSEKTLMITYNLTTAADIDLILYDISGNPVMRRKFREGSDGGKAGYNTVSWNGVTDLGRYPGNGIYVLKIVSRGKVLGISKIVVYD